MIYYHIVEWHQPDRVLQQFGLQQPIPLPAMQDRRLHNIQYQGNYNFDELLSDYIQIWNNRAAYVVQGYQLQRPPHYHSAYMEWFRSRSRRWITHEGAAAGQSVRIYFIIKFLLLLYTLTICFFDVNSATLSR